MVRVYRPPRYEQEQANESSTAVETLMIAQDVVTSNSFRGSTPWKHMQPIGYCSREPAEYARRVRATGRAIRP